MQCRHITSSQQSMDAFIEAEEQDLIYDYPTNSNIFEQLEDSCYTFKERIQQKEEQRTRTALDLLPIQGQTQRQQLQSRQKESKKAKDNYRQSSVTNSERRRATIEVQAKNLLLDESERRQKSYLFQPHSQIFSKRRHEDQKIEGFYNQESDATKTQQPATGSNKNASNRPKYSNLSTINSQIEYWSKRRNCLPIKIKDSKQYHQQPKGSSYLRFQRQQSETGNRTDHEVQPVLCKINNLREFDSEANDFQTLNRKFMAIQEKYLKRKNLIKKVHRTNNKQAHQNQSHMSRAQQYISQLDIRRLITRTGTSLKQINQGEYPFNQQINEQHIKTRYQHFKPNTYLLKGPKGRHLSAQPLSKDKISDAKVTFQGKSALTSKLKHQKGIFQQKIGSIFRRLKELKTKQINVNSKKHASLHNIHANQDSQDGIMKFHWKKQRNKIKNSLMKSETVDISRFSLQAGAEQRNAILSLLKTKNVTMSIKSRTEPSERGCQIISPVFISQPTLK